MLLIEALKGLIRGSRGMSDEEYYYSQSIDHIDLERRMREVQKNQAPFQSGYRG